MKEAKITLGEQEFTLTPFSIDELEQVSDLLNQGGHKAALELVKFALKTTAVPKVDDPGTLRGATMPQFNDAMRAIMSLAGVELSANPQEAAPPAAS